MTLTYKIEIKGLNDLIRKVEAGTREDVFRKSLSLGAANMAAWSKVNRFVANAHSKVVHPTMLTSRTGRLQSSISFTTPSNVGKDGNKYTASFGTNVEYAPRHEFGFSGVESVKDHIRTITTAFGRPIQPRQVFVSAFTRNVNVHARPFLRPSLEHEENRQRVIEILAENINEAIEKG